MLLRTPCTPRIARIHTNRIQWRRIPLRCYSSANSGDPPWFQQLQSELLQRDVTHIRDQLTYTHGIKLSQTLAGFLPRSWCRSLNYSGSPMTFGDHLVWFNPAEATSKLLPDGTDATHSPGEPWVRRMWAGGSIQLKPNGYLDYARCCTAGTVMAGTEQIKHVRLHGEGDTAKIFVTIERRFAGLEDAERGVDKGKHDKRPPGVSVHPQEAQGDLTQQLRAKVDDGWGDAVLKEERNLVFFKERTAAELEAVKAGQMATVKYLDPPGKPDFSHTLTPNRALLFRFSALTFNAHLIHLDPDYARNVEGHRNLLVHGPLSLTLMLKTVNHYVHQQTKGKQVAESIEYRNLAPLYCDEEMRICCLEKKKLQNGSIYDVWIEGPTGGVAVKGTLRTTTNDTWAKKDTGIAQTRSATPTDELKTKWPSFKRPEHPKLKRKILNTTNKARKMAKSSKNGTQVHVASRDQRPSQDSPAPPSSEPTTNPETSADSESSTSSEPSTQNQEK